ncbi:manganese transport protein [Catenulispora sp. GP43]|uniref:Nramp family divalent metal transporter n=1 Tax=Catenulispora sp. GP43 TaxID=3156263 RepID=UPI003511A49A
MTVQARPPRPSGEAVRRVRPAAIQAAVPVVGAAAVAGIAFVDPGNFAADAAAGAGTGYALLWAVLVASVAAAYVQYLAAKVGALSGQGLPELCRRRLPRAAVWPLWAQAEVVCAATDLAEVVGTATALHILTGLPPLAGALLAGAGGFAITSAKLGGQALERMMAAVLTTVFVCFAVIVAVVRPPLPGIAGGLAPRLPGGDGAALVAGLVGATIMPHVIYLHSALAARTPRLAAEETIRAQRREVTVAMTIAGLANLAMLAVFARALHGRADSSVTLEQTHRILAGLHPAAALIVVLALLVAGVASAGVGVHAGQEVMRGFLRRSPPATVRRLVTLVPSLILLGLGVSPTRALLLSQVVLSFGVPFGLAPLIWLARREDVMGERRAGLRATVAATALSGVLVALNVWTVATAL